MKSAVKSERATYLYSDKNLYHKVLDEFNQGNCLFSRNLMAYLENSSTQPGAFYGKHLSECNVCQEKVSRYKDLLHKVKSQVPYIQPERDFISHIEPELKEALSIYKKRLKREDKKGEYFQGDLIKRVGEDLLKGVFLTPAFIKGMLWSGIAGILLYIIL
ncbi:MAG: hypothetical protein NXH75_10915 [Halobacteriovoraceae bacterium]|nr:hypothetical protein [Halobacteriovoraceae bacterium]